MICQVGKVGMHRGQRYRLTFWAKAANLKAGGVEVSLVNTRDWAGSGLEGTFTPGPRWERFEFLFQCQHAVPAATSRLQVWFKSTGTLWLDDFALAETSDKPQWYPQIGTEGVTNAIPNSSFECGTAGWGSLTFGLGGWEGNLFRLEGECDANHSRHGRQSLKITLDAATSPVYWFDYMNSRSRRRNGSCSWPSGLTSRPRSATGASFGLTPCSSNGAARRPTITRVRPSSHTSTRKSPAMSRT